MEDKDKDKDPVRQYNETLPQSNVLISQNNGKCSQVNDSVWQE